jgi:hypothetical protein
VHLRLGNKVSSAFITHDAKLPKFTCTGLEKERVLKKGLISQDEKTKN